MFGTTKKTTAFVMTVSLLMGQLCTPAITSSGDELSVPGLGSYGYEDISEYVSSELPKFIRVYDPETECAYYSDMIPLYNAESEVRAYTVFVKDDDQALGQFTVACIHGELSASFVFTDYSEYVTELIDQGAEFVLFNDGSGLCLYGDGYVESLSNSNDVRLEAPEYTQCPSLPINGYDFSRIQMADRAWLPPSLYSSANAPCVANATNPYNGIKLCWLACLASISNYKNNTTYNTLSLFNSVWNAYGRSYSDIPIGTTTWMNRTLSYISVSLTHLTSGVSAVTVNNSLTNDMPGGAD